MNKHLTNITDIQNESTLHSMLHYFLGRPQFKHLAQNMLIAGDPLFSQRLFDEGITMSDKWLKLYFKTRLASELFLTKHSDAMRLDELVVSIPITWTHPRYVDVLISGFDVQEHETFYLNEEGHVDD
jgi:hypothetical protein